MKFPIIKNIIVENLSLFTQTIDLTIYPGVNMIIGGNGLGKTTLVNTILYALVGNASYDKLNARTGRVEPTALVERNYFVGRITPEDQDNAKVTLTISIDSTDLVIVRSLFRPSLLRFELNHVNEHRSKDSQVFEGDPDDLELKYQDIMAKLLEVGQFQHFVFLVSTLLVFGEERQTLLWNTDVQNRVIRLFFLDRDFDAKFDKYSNLTTRLDTTARHKSETRKDINKQINDWLRDKEESLEERASQSEDVVKQAELRMAQIQQLIDSCSDEITKSHELIDTEIDQVQSLNIEIDEMEAVKLPLSKQLEGIEYEFYSSVYRSVPPEYAFILENLIKRGTCQMCGTTDQKFKEIGIQLKKEGKCIVCGSPVRSTIDNTDSDQSDALTQKINEFRTRLSELDQSIQSRKEALAKAKAEINRLKDVIEEKARNKRHLEFELLQLRTKFEAPDDPESASFKEDDPWLARQKEKVDQLTGDIEGLYRKRDHARTTLKTLNKELRGVVQATNEQLTPLFSLFASKFLGIDCALVVSEKTRAGKPVTFMYPRFYDKDRVSMAQVSESQRFFLDQAFRMALITWYAQSTNLPAFYIIETPEGSLDLAYERNVADMYVEFSSYGHSIMVTSNLNSSNFLGGLYESLGTAQERQERTLDLLRYGHLSGVQKREEHMRAFNERARQLGLSLVWPE